MPKMLGLSSRSRWRGARRVAARAANGHRAAMAAGLAGAAGIGAVAAKAALHRLLAKRSPDGATGASRTYRLRRSESAPSGIRRVAAGRVDDAVEQLRGRGYADSGEAIHEARKDLKKVRAVLRLVRDELGEDLYRRENARFRDAGRRLSGPRDAQVKLETLDALRKRFSDSTGDGRFRPLAERLERERRSVPEVGDGSGPEPPTRSLERGRAAIDAWPLRSRGWGLLEPGLRRAYRRGRNRLRDASAERTSEALHEWRKRVKDLWYHLRLVQGAWPEVLEGLAEQAHRLSDLLGDDHDLAVLREDAIRARDAFDDPADADDLIGLIDRRRAELTRAAFSLGRRIYAEKPSDYVARLGSYWGAWRSS